MAVPELIDDSDDDGVEEDLAAAQRFAAPGGGDRVEVEEEEEEEEEEEDDDEEEEEDEEGEIAPPHLRSLAKALRFGNLDSLRRGLDTLNINIDDPIEDGDTALHLCCLYGHLSCVQVGHFDI
ncbi:hypothetical protein QJS10_CPB18g01800 [Acorus calamus]|uniref:Uncharacterized protein n=1 Tax=Acorus calamus TaxID=4465 RepID=A0AAV9CL24_ACOCL|nr:hypothetical protein QJS10_CPB18g01800 [Acorus calamus]